MAEFKYEITQELGVISEGKYNIELNMVSWYSASCSSYSAETSR